MTAPALYRYVDSHEDLVRIVAMAIDAERRAGSRRRATAQPADDPAARMVASAVAFRQLGAGQPRGVLAGVRQPRRELHRGVQRESKPGCSSPSCSSRSGTRYRFPVPALDDLDPELVAILRDPCVPADLTGVPASCAR